MTKKSKIVCFIACVVVAATVLISGCIRSHSEKLTTLPSVITTPIKDVKGFVENYNSLDSKCWYIQVMKSGSSWQCYVKIDTGESLSSNVLVEGDSFENVLAAASKRATDIVNNKFPTPEPQKASK